MLSVPSVVSASCARQKTQDVEVAESAGAGAAVAAGQPAGTLREIVESAVRGCLAGALAGERERCSVAEMRSRLRNFTAREVDDAMEAPSRRVRRFVWTMAGSSCGVSRGAE